MGDGSFGLTEAVSMALGGMIGGGIYAVLGVVTGIARAATWFAFLLAGIFAICAAYSYVGLNELATDDGDDDSGGGSVTFVQSFTGNSTLAGMIGWTLLFGYVGSMAMYAFAFAEFTISLPGVPSSIGGLPLRPGISVLVIAGFVGLNLLGTRATGSAENVLTSVKVLVLVAFGLAGVVYALFVSSESVAFGTSRLTSFSPIMAAAVSFVAFQGWQLLFYDQESIADPLETIPKAIYLSIPVAVVIYMLVALVTYNLAPSAIQHNPHTALVNAASTIGGAVGLASAAGIVISLSALFSTGSAINATLFSAGYFAKGMLTDDLLPDRAGDASVSGVPTRTLLILGVVTAAFTAYGSLSAITAFASLSFIIVFGAMCALALGQRDTDRIAAAPPAVGALGGGLSFVLMFYHLYTAERGTFYAVLLIAVAVFAAELLYFERDVLEEEIPYVDHDAETAAD
ncbi:APC family permease [Natrinema salinisoli]|uniref:APC family permease n=1 Tax=Natrinema salinisoli TaxID=2878535 RepID=UPI001CEFBFB0|nr:APC family permease [Natrinema salinisoli]